MSRVADADFSALLAFLGKYSLSDELKSSAFLKVLRLIHRRHLALLILWAEFSSRIGNGTPPRLDGINLVTLPVVELLQEAISDVSEGFFCASQGSYKAAHALLRSAVENFVRGCGSLSNPKIAGLTSVFQVFDESKIQPFFLTAQGVRSFVSLRACYGKLCSYVHSAAPAHEVAVHALDYFPRHDAAALRQWQLLFDRVAKAILESILVSEPALFLAIDFRNQDVISDLLSPASLRKIHGG